MKVCTKCLTQKEDDEFYKHKRYVDGIKSWCKKCESSARSIRRISNPEAFRRIELKRLYGITIEQYNKMFSEQGGCCAICNRHQAELNKILFVDHDHKSNEVRGLLCQQCNHALGLFRDSQEIINSAINYLNKSKIRLVI